jgi:hypothetical protein
MGITDILIILGCLAGGYWIVSSVMGPGIDITRRKPPEAPDSPAAPPAPSAPQARTPARPSIALLPRPANSHQHDWHIVLDVPRTASRSDIEAAFRHQQKKAEASRDAMLLQRLQQARDAGLAALK